MNATRTLRSWTNFETYVVANTILSDVETTTYWLDQAMRAIRVDPNSCTRTLAAQMRSQHEESTPDLVDVLADLLGAAIQKVDWLEIAAYFVAIARMTR